MEQDNRNKRQVISNNECVGYCIVTKNYGAKLITAVS
jgi:hypothetical protein